MQDLIVIDFLQIACEVQSVTRLKPLKQHVPRLFLRSPLLRKQIVKGELAFFRFTGQIVKPRTDQTDRSVRESVCGIR